MNMISPGIEKSRQLDKSDFPNKVIEQRAVKDLIIFRGVIAERPSTGDTEKQVFFAEDENKLYIWNRQTNSWKSVTLS